MKWEREKSSLEFQSMCTSEIGCSSPIILDLEKLIDSESWILYDIGVACGTLAVLDKLSISYPGALAQLGERIAGSDEVRGSIPLGSITKNAITLV